MSEQKPGRAFRWKGPGVLHIRNPDTNTTVVVPPGDHDDYLRDPRANVKNKENLLLLGWEQVENFIKQGLASAITLTDEVVSAFKGEKIQIKPLCPACSGTGMLNDTPCARCEGTGMIDDDISKAQEIATASARMGEATRLAGEARIKAGPQLGDSMTDEQRIRDMRSSDEREARIAKDHPLGA